MLVLAYPILDDIHLWHVQRKTCTFSVTFKEVRDKETLFCLCQWIRVEIKESNEMESVRLPIHTKVHVIKYVLLLGC